MLEAPNAALPEADSPACTDLHVVGIGASAGGLEALETFFQSMPEDSGMAFVVIQHLSPDFKSQMDHLIARKTNIQFIMLWTGSKFSPTRSTCCQRKWRWSSAAASCF